MTPELGSLSKRVQNKIGDLSTLHELAQDSLRVLDSLSLSRRVPERGTYKHYVLLTATGENKRLRPVNEELFVWKAEQFEDFNQKAMHLLKGLRDARTRLQNPLGNHGLSRWMYTAVQSLGCILDITTDSNTARKNFGMRFEEVVSLILSEAGIFNMPVTLKIPVESLKGRYTVSLDRVLSVRGDPRPTTSEIDENEVVLSIKTSSKDRMKLIFADRYVLQRLLKNRKIKYAAVFHNDVQRRGNNIQATFVPTVFWVFCRVFQPLAGVYYVDMPPNAQAPVSRYLRSFEDFLLRDVWKLLGDATLRQQEVSTT